MIKLIMIEISTTILIYIVVIILFFFLIREIVTWYWKINRIVETLDRIDNNIALMADVMIKKDPEIAKKISQEAAQEDLE